MSKKFRAKKLISIALSVAMAAAITVVPSFASSSAEVLSDAVLIGSTPYAGAKAVAPGSAKAPQPIRLAFSEGAATIAADINSYVDILSDAGEATIKSATADGNIVTITLSAALSSNTTYTVDFDQDYLPKVADFTFKTSKGGTGTGTGSGSGTGGGTPGSQALLLTGKIPTDNATVDASQVMYLTFSTNIKSLESNVDCFYIRDSEKNLVDATVSIIDNWTAEISVSNLAEGSYTLVVDKELTAQSGNELGTEVNIVFNV